MEFDGFWRFFEAKIHRKKFKIFWSFLRFFDILFCLKSQKVEEKYFYFTTIFSSLRSMFVFKISKIIGKHLFLNKQMISPLMQIGH